MVGILVAANGVPRLPGDAEDDERDQEADDRVRDLRAERDERGRQDDAERDEAVDARVVPVGGHRGACEAAPGRQAHVGGELVPGEADRAGGAQDPRWSGARGG